MRITAIKYGQSLIWESVVFEGGDDDAMLPISFVVYLIETEKRKILVDAGCTTMPDCWKMQHFCGVLPLLKTLNISPEEITDVIITHAHHDHIQTVHAFSKARIYIQEDELVEGKSYIPSRMPIVTFKDEYAVYPDVTAVKIGGHSIGSSIVEIATAHTTYVIAGDECYSMDCLIKSRPIGVSYCPENSKAFIEKYRQPCYTVLLCHDGALLPNQSGCQIIFDA